MEPRSSAPQGSTFDSSPPSYSSEAPSPSSSQSGSSRASSVTFAVDPKGGPDPPRLSRTGVPGSVSGKLGSHKDSPNASPGNNKFASSPMPGLGAIESMHSNPFTRAYRWLFPRRGWGHDAGSDATPSALTPVTPLTPHEAMPFLNASHDGGDSGGYGSRFARVDDAETLLGSDQSQIPFLPDASYTAKNELVTTWQHEAIFILRSSIPMVVVYSLWQSMSISGLFIVGRLGNAQLGAVNLAVMTINVIVYCPVLGVAAALDTLCPQAYGAGQFHLVGVHVQRATCFLVVLLMPIIAALWWGTGPALTLMIKERDTIDFAVLYVRIAVLSAPATAAWECSRRFLQAQGIFYPLMWIHLICAPLNVLLGWLLCWRVGLGFVGVPIAYALTQNMMPLLLVLYVWRVDGQRCWGGFSRRAFENWRSMASLAIPSLIMGSAEMLSFEIFTFAAGSLGPIALATQSIMVTTTYGLYKIPLGISIAGSTRVATFLGARQVRAARLAAKVLHCISVVLGLSMSAFVILMRRQIPLWITDDPDIIEAAAKAFLVIMVHEIPDAITCQVHALLRAIGRQRFGGWSNLVVWFLFAVPLALFLGVHMGFGVGGLWAGGSTGMAVVGIVEVIYLWTADWHAAADEAAERNRVG